MLQSLRIFQDVRSFREIFERIPWRGLKKLAALPCILFFLSPLLLLVHTTFQFWYLEQTIDSINRIVMEYAAILFVICLFKAACEGRSLRILVKRNLVILFFGFFILMILISTVINITQPYQVEGTWRREYFYSYILYAAGYFGCAALINTERMKCGLLRLLQVVSLVQVFLVFFDRHVIQIEPFHRIQVKHNVTSVFSNRNFYCYYLTIVILISAALFVLGKNKKWRIFDGVCFLANSFTMMRADTLGTFIAVLFGLVFLLIMLRIVDGTVHRIIFALIGVFIGLFLFNALLDSALFQSFLKLFTDINSIIRGDEDADKAGTSRWILWRKTVQYIGERPLFGWGTEGIYDRLLEEGGNSRPHNEYLQYAAFYGIPASISYICGVVSVFVHGLRHKKELDIYTLAAFTGAFGYLVSACFGNTVYSVAPYFFCVLGLACRVCRKDD